MTAVANNELAIYEASVPDRMRYASALANSTLLPPDYRGKEANVLLAVEMGSALHVAPMVAINEIHVIKGKPTLSAQLMSALVRRAGHTLRIAADDTHAVCEIVRADDPEFTFRTEWTLDRAKKAGLLSNDMWTKYPRNMLKSRAISECARDACPDVIAGFGYTAEELGDESDVPAFDDTDPLAPATPSVTVTVVDEPASFTGLDYGDLIDSATTLDEVRAIWKQIGEAGAMSEEWSSRLSQRAEDIKAEPVDAVVVDETPADGMATRGQLQSLSILLGQLGITARQDCLDFISASIGRVIGSRKELTAAEVATAIQECRRHLGESAREQQGA